MLSGNSAGEALTPEGWDDLTLSAADGVTFIQVKSRQPHLGSFPKPDAAKHIIDTWSRLNERATESDRFLVVLERPVAGFDASGFEARELASAIRARAKGHADVQSLLDRTAVRVMANPLNDAAAALAQPSGSPKAHWAPHVQALRSLVGEATDHNASARDEFEAASITRTTVARTVEDISIAVNPALVVEAIETGTCEVVDFSTQVVDPDLYLGVDIVAGHISSGQVFDRDEVTEAVLETPGVPALISGPSGAGKSAALFLTAYADRSRVWYAVRRLRTDDVPAIGRMIRGLQPNRFAPVGLIVDNVGKPGFEGWDDLVDQHASSPGVTIVGAARTEDLPQIRRLSACRLVPLSLSEDLANRVFGGLQSASQTQWSHWREPYEQSGSLLLEYVHLLTKGERMAAVISDQIRARRTEERWQEIAVLAFAGIATAHGARVHLEQIKSATGLADYELSTSMERLSNEHLLRVDSDGYVAAVHRLRSSAIVRAIHSTPPPTRPTSVGLVIKELSPDQLEGFVVEVLSADRQLDEPVFAALKDRLHTSPTAAVAAAALRSLRVVDFRRQADPWPSLMARFNVAPSKQGTTALLTLSGLDFSSLVAAMDPTVRDAMRAISSMLSTDSPLRDALVEDLASELTLALAQTTDLGAATALLSGLGGCARASDLIGWADLVDTPIHGAISNAEIHVLEQFVAAGTCVCPEAGTALLDLAGGLSSIVERVSSTHPWLLSVQAGRADSGLLDGREADFDDLLPGDSVVRITYLKVEDTDVRGKCKQIAQQVVSCAPGVALVRTRAVDARGQSYGYRDHHPAEMWLKRSTVPSNAQVEWNQTRLRTVARLLGTATRTERARIEAKIIEDAASFLGSFLMHWVRSDINASTLKKLSDQRIDLLRRVEQLPPLLEGLGEVARSLEDETTRLTDPVESTVLSMLSQLVNQCSPGDANYYPLAYTAHTLLTEQLEAVRRLERWELIGEDAPHDALERLTTTVADAHAVASELASGLLDPGEAARIALRSPDRRKSLGRLAEHSREALATRVEDALTSFAGAIGVERGDLVVVQKPTAKPSLAWPPTDFLIGVRVGRIDVWTRTVAENLVDARAHLPEHSSVTTLPIRDERPIVTHALHLVNDHAYPREVDVSEWEFGSNVTPHKMPLTEFWQEVMVTSVPLSTIATIDRDLAEDEQAIADAVAARLVRAVEGLVEAARSNPDDEVLQGVARVSLSLCERLNEEVAGNAQQPSLAADFLTMIHDEVVPDRLDDAVACSLLLVEWDIDPQVAQRMLDDYS